LHHTNQKLFKTFVHEGEGKSGSDLSCSLQFLGAVDMKLLTGPGKQWDNFHQIHVLEIYLLYTQHQAFQKCKKNIFHCILVFRTKWNTGSTHRQIYLHSAAVWNFRCFREVLILL